MGRFINADAYASTGQGLLGNNMFAYCGNNPVNHSDPNGFYFRSHHSDIAMLFYEGIGGGCFSSSGRNGGSFKETITNKSEKEVIDAEHFAFYNGTLVIKVPGDSAFSFGVIFFGDDIESVNLVRHEYGHTKQLRELGISGYTASVAIPSVICYWLDETNILPEGVYYSLPWEYIADEYGQVTWGHQAWAEPVASVYWDVSKLFSNITNCLY